MKTEIHQMKTSFTSETHEITLKIKAKEEQLRSANEYLEIISSEREIDRSEIQKLTQELTQERRKRQVDSAMISEMGQQVCYFPIVHCRTFSLMKSFVILGTYRNMYLDQSDRVLSS